MPKKKMKAQANSKISKQLAVNDPRPLIVRNIEIEEDGAAEPIIQRVTINLAESPLGWLHARGHLDDRQLLAGEKLRHDFESAALGARVTMRWDGLAASRQRRSSPEPVSPSEAMIIAKQRFHSAIACLDRDLQDIAWRVICNNEAITQAERELKWPQRAGKLVLRIALDRLAAHYRIAPC